jgi:hypothetical protein
MCIGLVTSIGYHILVKFPDSHKKGNQDEDTSSNNTSVDWSWFREYQLYQIGFVYMATRLYVNLAQAYIPFFLQVNNIKLMALSVYISDTKSKFVNIFHLIGQRSQSCV